jgi:uncharacterized membrane protein (UPF0127 family)
MWKLSVNHEELFSTLYYPELSYIPTSNWREDWRHSSSQVQMVLELFRGLKARHKVRVCETDHGLLFFHLETDSRLMSNLEMGRLDTLG